MLVLEQAGRDLLVSLGMPTCNDPKTVSRKKVLSRLRNAPEMSAKEGEKLEGDNKLLFERICEVISEQGTDAIELEGEKEEATNEIETNETHTKKKGGKKMTTATKTRKSTKTENGNGDGFPRDDWGSRLGSDCAKVNALLSSEPKNEPDLRKEAGVKSSVEYHLDKMVRLGRLKWKSNQGYFLPNKK